jgi:inositol oxygenase
MVGLRNFVNAVRQSVVEENYAKNHREMTVELVNERIGLWGGLSHGEYSIKEVIDLLDNFVDDSDPDVETWNIIHAFQTAEKIRKDYPDEDWMHLTGLLHDLGKVLCVWGEPQHLVVGDTFVVGCKHPDEIVFHKYFSENPDTRNLIYKSEYGVYDHAQGLDNLTLSWGHDEYMYRVLEGNDSQLPKLCHRIIRYHSFYSWHRDGAYCHLASRDDQQKLLPIMKKFSEYDLYSKIDTIPDCQRLWNEYYSVLCDKYCLGGKLRW